MRLVIGEKDLSVIPDKFGEQGSMDSKWSHRALAGENPRSP